MKKKNDLYSHEHNKQWGGIIEIEDFNTYNPNPNRIKNHVDAIKFNKIMYLKHMMNVNNSKMKDSRLCSIKVNKTN